MSYDYPTYAERAAWFAEQAQTPRPGNDGTVTRALLAVYSQLAEMTEVLRASGIDTGNAVSSVEDAVKGLEPPAPRPRRGFLRRIFG